MIGQTALHKAAAYKRRTICCMLVAAGASLLVHDGAGLSPRQLALMAEDLELAEYLESQEHFQVRKTYICFHDFVRKSIYTNSHLNIFTYLYFQVEKNAGGDPTISGDFETPV